MKAEIDPKIGKRLRTWKAASNHKLLGLSKLIKVSQGSLSDLQNGKSLPSANTLINLWTLTDLNIIWLLTGEGPMIKAENIDTSTMGKTFQDLAEIMGETKNKILIFTLFEILRGANESKKALLRAVLLGIE